MPKAPHVANGLSQVAPMYKPCPRVKRVKPIPEPLVRAAKTYADEARRLGASLDDAFNALCAQW